MPHVHSEPALLFLAGNGITLIHFVPYVSRPLLDLGRQDHRQRAAVGCEADHCASDRVN
jgi:hypothetical protein